ncbi:hypothetical protein QQX98_001598 [Neonectria punicea]|uniref:Uncharacterized protein n=1 Tax=Neonectria punicea TaxID=979145 RepID=A0ABR1HMX9_9HYPO
MQPIEDASAIPSTPERRRQDDWVFSTPTCRAELTLKIAILDRRYDEKWEDYQISTPKCDADIEEHISNFKKHRDDYFDDFCVVMRKTARKMDTIKAETTELQRETGILKAQVAAQLAAQESSSDGSGEDEVVGTSPRMLETANVGDEVEQQTGPPARNLRSRKRKTETGEEEEAGKKKAGKRSRSRKTQHE